MRVPRGAMVVTGIGLSLAFQAQSLAHAHPSNERNRAARASERPGTGG